MTTWSCSTLSTALWQHSTEADLYSNGTFDFFREYMGATQGPYYPVVILGLWSTARTKRLTRHDDNTVIKLSQKVVHRSIFVDEITRIVDAFVQDTPQTYQNTHDMASIRSITHY